MKIKPVLFLLGNDAFSQRLAISEIRATLFPEGSKGMNDDVFHAGAARIAEVLDLANTFPMFAPKRLVVFHGAERLKEAEQDQFLAYANKPCETTCLVMVSSKLDQRTRFFKSIKKLDCIIGVDPPSAQEMPAWIDKRSQIHGVQLSGGAKGALAESVGTDLSRLDEELKKLLLYVHPKTRIEEADVRELVESAGDENVFAFSEAVAERKIPEALSLLSTLVSSGTAPLALLSLLVRHFRILLKVQSHIREGGSPRDVARAIAVPPFAAQRYLSQAKSWKNDEVKVALDRLVSLDREMKSVGLPPERLFEQAILGIAG